VAAHAVSGLWTFVLIAGAWKIIQMAIGSDGTVSLSARLVMGGALILLVTGIWWGWPGEGWAPDELTPAVVRDAMDLNFAGGWHDKYPPFHYVVLAATYVPFLVADRLGLIAAWTPEGQSVLMLVSRLLSVAMALGTLRLLTHLGTRLFTSRVGVLSALCGVTFLPFVYYGKMANLDVPYVFWFLLSLVFWEDIRRTGSLRAYVGFAASGAIAVATKDQAYGLYVLPAVAILWSSVRRGEWRNMALAIIVAALTFVLCFNLLFNASGFIAHMQVMTGPASSGYRMFPSTIFGVVQLLGVIGSQLLFCVGIAGATAIVVALAEWYRDRRRAQWWLLLPILSLVLTFILVVGYVYDRFLLPVLGVLSIVAATGLERMLESRGRSRYAAMAGVALVVVLVWRAASLDALLVTDSRYAVERWLRNHVGPADTVASFGDRTHLPRFDEFLHLTLEGTREDTLRTSPRFIVVNTRWMKRYPPDSPRGEWLAWLESGRAPYRESLRHRTSMGPSLLRFDRTFTDRVENTYTNLDKINPEIVIFERTLPASPAQVHAGDERSAAVARAP